MLWLLFALLQDPAVPPTPPAGAVPPVTSLERIKRALAEPLPPFEGRATFRPVFRVTVRESLMPDLLPWETPLGRPAYVQPQQSGTHYEFLSTVTPEDFRAATLHPIGVDMLGVLRWLHKGVKQEARQRAERKAREQVERELAELLAARAKSVPK